MIGVEWLAILLVVLVLLLVAVVYLIKTRNGLNLNGRAEWALAAIAAAYNVAVDELKTLDELPSGDERRALAVAYYEHIPMRYRTFTVTEFVEAVQLAFEFIDAGATTVAAGRGG